MRKIILALMLLALALGATSAPALAQSETARATFFVPATAGGGSEELGGTPWLAPGLMLKPGTTITVSAAGLWQSCQERSCATTADGIGVKHVRDCTYIAPDLSAFSLIARVGTADPVIVGVGPTTIQGSGALTFAINDCYFGDNGGGFTVTVTFPADAVIVNPDADAAA
ncbi:MAG: LecA/PA-IL family lectin [Thermomicrobiales bacterium]